MPNTEVTSSISPSLTASEATGVRKLLCTPAEAAAVLSISRTKVYELMGTGALAFVRIGTARRVPAAALREFVDTELRRQGFLL